MPEPDIQVYLRGLGSRAESEYRAYAETCRTRFAVGGFFLGLILGAPVMAPLMTSMSLDPMSDALIVPGVVVWCGMGFGGGWLGYRLGTGWKGRLDLRLSNLRLEVRQSLLDHGLLAWVLNREPAGVGVQAGRERTMLGRVESRLTELISEFSTLQVKWGSGNRKLARASRNSEAFAITFFVGVLALSVLGYFVSENILRTPWWALPAILVAAVILRFANAIGQMVTGGYGGMLRWAVALELEDILARDGTASTVPLQSPRD